MPDIDQMSMMRWLRFQSPRRRNLVLAAIFDTISTLVVIFIPMVFGSELDRVTNERSAVVLYLLGLHRLWIAAFVGSAVAAIVAVVTKRALYERIATSVACGVAFAWACAMLAVSALVFPRFAVALIVCAIAWLRMALTLYIGASQVTGAEDFVNIAREIKAVDSIEE